MWNEVILHSGWWALGTVCLCLIIFAGVSVKMSWLTYGGAVGMILTGCLIDLAFDLRGLLVIGIFFLTSNLVGKLLNKAKITSHEPRTLKQVLANGGMPLLAALFVVMGGTPLFGLGCFLASIGEATADTWASELGTRIGHKPYHIALRERVEPGLSGAVTAFGSAFGGIGALFIGCVSTVYFFHYSLRLNLIVMVVVAFSGWAGQWLDTILGAYFQARYQCLQCGVLTDHDVHCGKKATLLHGFCWMTNNLVNACSSVGSGLLGGIIFYFVLEGNGFVI